MTSKIFADGQPYPLSRRAFLGWVMAGMGSVALVGKCSATTFTPQPKPQAAWDGGAAACLSMVARHWGKRIDPASLHFGNVSFALDLTAAIIKAAQSNGFKTYTQIYMASKPDPLLDQPGPWLACWGLWGDARWIVVRGWQDDHLLIDSPSTGRRLIPWAEFKKQWHKPITLLLLP